MENSDGPGEHKINIYHSNESGQNEIFVETADISGGQEEHGANPEISVGQEEHGTNLDIFAEQEEHGTNPEISAVQEEHGANPEISAEQEEHGTNLEISVGQEEHGANLDISAGQEEHEANSEISAGQINNIQQIIIERIDAQANAEGSIPSYFRERFDFTNHKYPSIFHFPDRTDTITVAAIGPYRRSVLEQQLIITDAKKRDIVNFLVQTQTFDIKHFLQWVLGKKETERARLCYESGSLGNIQDSKDFAEMLLLDGCLILFAIFLLRSNARIDNKPYEMSTNSEYGSRFTRLCADIKFHTKQLKLELLMLDNQIPFFVVKQLYTQLETSLFAGVDGKIEEMAVSCFDGIHPRCNYNKEFPEIGMHHLLHLFHRSRSPIGKYKVVPRDFVPNEPNSQLPSATELSESATLFMKKPSGSSLDISFHHNMFRMRGEMSIPVLYLYDHSELIFRNLIAFEQSHLNCGIGVTAFCICMARLLQSETDAKLLRKNRILAHTNKTDQEIVDFFKKLSGEYKDTFMPKHLLELYTDVATYRESRQCGFMEDLFLYFPNRWTTISITFASIALFLTLINTIGTIHSMYRYYHP